MRFRRMARRPPAHEGDTWKRSSVTPCAASRVVSFAAPSDERNAGVSADPTRRRRGRLSRPRGRRPLSLARGPRVGRHPRVDRRRERSHAPVPGSASATRGAGEAPHRALELSADRASVSRRRSDSSISTTPGCSSRRPSIGAHRSPMLRSCCSIPTPFPPTAASRSRSGCLRPMGAISPMRCRRAAPTGPTSTCAISRRAPISPASFAGSASRASRGRRTATDSSMRAFPSLPPARRSRPTSTTIRSGITASARRRTKTALIYWRRELPRYFVGADVSDDGRYLTISLFNGTDPKNRLLLCRSRRSAASRHRRADRRDCRRGHRRVDGARQRRPGVLCPHRSRRAQSQDHRDRSAPVRRPRRMEVRRSGKPECAGGRDDGRRAPFLRVPRRCRDRRAHLLARRQGRRRARPAGHFQRAGNERPHERRRALLRRHVAPHGADGLSLRHRRAPLRDPRDRQRRPSMPRRTRRDACSTRRRTARASRCSSPAARDSCRTARIRRGSTATAASRSA